VVGSKPVIRPLPDSMGKVVVFTRIPSRMICMEEKIAEDITFE